jgi:transcriptional regulator
MYNPPQFKETQPDVLHSLMRKHPLAAVVALTAQGIQANHIPLVFEPRAGSLGMLKGHIARANSLWRDLEAGAEVLALFQGASHYISPNWYPAKAEHGKVVPTWNYAVVHARGRIAWIHDASWLRDFVGTLTDRHESELISPWHVSDAPPKYVEQMIEAIVGFEITISDLVGKWKLSQNRSAADRAGVVSSLSVFADDAAQEMARLVDRPDKGFGR